MTSKRIYYIMIACLALLVAAILGGTFLANQQFQKQSAKLNEYKTQAAVLNGEQAGLSKAKKDIETYSSLETIAKTIVPQDKDQAVTVREIVNIAGESGIKPTSITFPVSTLGGPAGSSGGTSSTRKVPSQLAPVKGMTGVYDLQITIQLDGTSAVPYSKFLDFLSRLEKNRRTAQVIGIVLQPSATNRNLVSFTLTLEEFIKP